MLQPETRQQLAREAFRLANDLEMDLITGAQLYNHARAGFGLSDPSVEVALKRICLFHTMITLSKWTELYESYKAVFPEVVRGVAKRLHKDITDRGIVQFRNTVVGHIRDQSLRRPLTTREVEERLAALTKNDIPAFFAWVSTPGMTEEFPDTVVATLERVRDEIRADFGLSDADLRS